MPSPSSDLHVISFCGAGPKRKCIDQRQENLNCNKLGVLLSFLLLKEKC
jgi:hypothetical protein